MGNILGLVVTYKWVFVGVAVFLILALIGAFADKKQSERFKFAEKKEEVNLTSEEKSAGETKDVSNTANNRAVGNDFSADANNAAKAQMPAPENKPEAPKVETPKTENQPAVPAPEVKKADATKPDSTAVETPKA